MNTTSKHSTSQVVMRCDNLDEAVSYFTTQLGFRLDMIFPADSPRVAIVSNADNRIRLVAGSGSGALYLRVAGDAPSPPAGLEIELVEEADELTLPPLVSAFVLRRAKDGGWGTGRAGMQYRDLLPTRLGGRFIASHIRIPTGGPVPDYVHHHRIRFQMIYCYRGWVRVVYEGQGEPFVMRAGDCVLQPPHIRHQVLECSDGFEVLEVGCPAEHETLLDHQMQLPTPTLETDRDFGGQRFVFHRVRDAAWRPWRDGFEARDTGIAKATRSLAGVLVVRASGELDKHSAAHDAEFLFRFILSGEANIHVGEESPRRVGAGDAIAIPAGTTYAFRSASDDLEMLEVALPADYATKAI